MNYLKEILTFENWVEYNSGINKSDIRLWYTLLHLANRFAWREFTIPISTLIFKSKLSKSDIYRARNKLKQFGLLEFKENGSNKSTAYKIKSCASLFGTQVGTEIDTESDTANDTAEDTANGAIVGNYNKTKNQKPKTRNKKEINKESFGEFENVLLSEQELDKLKSRFGDKTDSYIERLSNYIASTGKRYKSHYATILAWTAKDNQNNKSGGESCGNNQKYPAKKLCTEYPE